MVADPHVDIVIPTWNGWKLLEACLHSIVAQQYSRYTITVVDNGSCDGTIKQLKLLFPKVRIVSFAENTGFSAAVNAGIKAGSHPLVFLLNNDTELASDCLDQLVYASQHNEQLFFAAKLLSFHDRKFVDGAGDGYLRGGAGYRLGTMEHDDGQYDLQREVFGACAGAALYRRTFFEKVGYFDEAFFAYLEDVDINLRACRQGFACLFVPQARVYHVGSATTGSKINPVTVRLSTRNSFFVLLKNYSLFLFIRYLPIIALYQFCWLLFCLKRGQFAAYLSGLAGVLPEISRLRRKYKQSKKNTLDCAEITAKLQNAEREVVDSIMRRRAASGKSNTLLAAYRLLFL